LDDELTVFITIDIFFIFPELSFKPCFKARRNKNTKVLQCSKLTIRLKKTQPRLGFLLQGEVV